MFFQPQYLQDVRGHSAVASGGADPAGDGADDPHLALLRPPDRPLGARRLMTAGMAAGTLGLVVLTRLAATSPYGLLLAGYMLFGIALGLVYAPMSTAAMAAMPREKVGTASGVLAMDRVMAGTIALAATGALFHALLDGGSSFSSAVAQSTWLTVAICVVGTVLTWRSSCETRRHAVLIRPWQATHPPMLSATTPTIAAPQDPNCIKLLHLSDVEVDAVPRDHRPSVLDKGHSDLSTRS
jgi:MFS family permease